ncbi:uncharacterized protein STEHIDRAFT_163961 [Stereum hirsutum FP-91666 SS1]|uniref:Uncharacterized protein n=1 Tax=Stereum hirsutum (strain FP-91666) TaxID=721885 RepID=R7RWJ8_STEHR|nr:uncharacterized protein STEHIDRAFT_163961 [Stereum hirsutum FP-91666 SS1]EIM79138.1 hypothetical protein STEHIDRAFT_163961 [Stereum hirsutum FP-91666 SS1]
MAHNFDQTALAELQEKFTLLESKTNACLDTHECRLSECAEKIQELQSMVDKVKRTQSALSTALAEFEMQLASSYSKLANQTAELSNTMEGDVHHIKHTMDALEARTDLRHDRLWNMVLEQTERGLCTLCTRKVPAPSEDVMAQARGRSARVRESWESLQSGEP